MQTAEIKVAKSVGLPRRASTLTDQSGQSQYGLIAAVITIGWLLFFLDFETNYNLLLANSQSIRGYFPDSGVLVGLGLIGTYTIALFSTWLLLRHLPIFLCIWLFSLAVSEAQVPVLQPLMMLVRYMMMASLIVYGMGQIFASNSQGWTGTQKFGVVILCLVFIHLFAGASSHDAYLMLPMQLTMFVGVFFGLYSRFSREDTLNRIAVSVASVGMLLTILHVSSLVFSPYPFDGGRFKSWHLLATGFANNYVLFLISMVWYFIFCKSTGIKYSSLFFVVLGLYLLMLSGSRNALLTLVVASFAMCVLWRPKYLFYIGGILIVSLIGLAATDGAFFDLGKAGDRLSTVNAKEIRFGVWAMAWSYIQQNMWLGYGLSANLRDLSSFLPSWESFDAHNAYLGIWLRFGFFGFVSYLIVYFVALKKGFHYLKKRTSEKDSVALFWAILAALFISGLFEENLSSRGSVQQGLWAISVTIIGYLARYSNRKTVQKKAYSNG